MTKNDLLSLTIRWLEELSDPDGLHDGWHDVGKMSKLALEMIMNRETEVVTKANTMPENWFEMDWKEVYEIQKENRKNLRTLLQETAAWNSQNEEYVGEIISFAVADSQAEYMVKQTRPLQLIWLSDTDEYSAHPATIRGLTLDDVKHQVDFQRKIKLRGKK